MDQTRRQARAEFAGAPARLIGAAGAALERALDTAAILLAAEQLGAARWALEMTVEQAKNRVQFGRPIGSFQAVKHRCAELLVDVEAARSAVAAGLRALDAESPDIPVLASLAQACCSELATRVTAENIQIHGGLGFTWEHPAHLYFKRAKSSEVLLGGPAHHRERFVQRMGF